MSETKKFEEFKLTVDGLEKTFRVYEPSVEDVKVANRVKNKEFMDALRNKAPLRAQVNTILRDRGEWDDERQAQYDTLQKKILDGEKRLKAGGFKLGEARALALEIRDDRAKVRNLLSDRSSLDNMTAEGQSDNAYFNALVASSLVYINEEGKEARYFVDVDDYIAKSYTEVAFTAASKLSTIMYSIGDSVERGLPETQFLLKYKFVDEQLRLINKQGHLIDSDGRLVDDKGHYVDENGNLVDKFGTPVNKDGEYQIDSKPFLDDDGNEIKEESAVPPPSEVKEPQPTE